MGLQGAGCERSGEVTAALHIVQAAPVRIEGVGKRVFPRKGLGGAGQGQSLAGLRSLLSLVTKAHWLPFVMLKSL